MIRWTCSQCGTGLNAPSRLAKNDTRRFCLPCSAGSKRLVERTAPRLVRQRAVRSARAAIIRKENKARKVNQRARKASAQLVNGVDCEKLMMRLATLPLFGGRKGEVYRKLKQGWEGLTIHRCASRPRKLGHYKRWNGIDLFVWPTISEASLRETLIHELLHMDSYLRPWKCNGWLVGHDGKCRIKHCRHFIAKMKTGWSQATRRMGELVPRDGSKLHEVGSNGRFLVHGTIPYTALEGPVVASDEAA